MIILSFLLEITTMNSEEKQGKCCYKSIICNHDTYKEKITEYNQFTYLHLAHKIEYQ